MTFPLHDDGEQGPDTDGLAKARLEYLEEWRTQATVVIRADQALVVELEARIARKEAANEALVQRVFALEAKHEATMRDMRRLLSRLAGAGIENEALQLLANDRLKEARRLSDLLIAAEEERARAVTGSEQAAEQMRQDILGGKIDRAGRQVVRDACDKMDAPKTGRDASNDALGRISGRGGVMSGWGR